MAMTLYAALGSAMNNNILSELSSNGYARQAVTATYDPITGVMTFSSGATFGPDTSSNWTAATSAALFDASAAGNMLMSWPVPSVSVTVGGSYTPAGNGTAMQFNAAARNAFAMGTGIAAGTAVGNIVSNASAMGAGNATMTSGVALSATSSAIAAGSPVANQNPINFRNLLDGGDFTVNPWQRNIGGLASTNVIASAVSNTVTYFADRWFAVGGASSSILMTKVADTSVPGFSQSLKLSRTAANTDTAAFNFGQVLETADSVHLQGRQVTFSFWAKAGANYSGGALTAQVISGTGTNDTAAHMVAASWTGQLQVVNATQALTTVMTRYQFTGSVPANATQVGSLLTWTPSGTAGADDSVTLNGLQLEVGSAASEYERRDLEVELALCQRYAVVFAEPASGVAVSGAGMMTGTANQQVTLPLPTTMRIAPAVTLSAGSFKFNVAGVATAVGAGFAAGATHTPTMLTVVGTVTSTAGQATALQGGGGSGYIVASADF